MLSAALLAACSHDGAAPPPAEEPVPFRFETTRADTIDLRVTSAQQPLPRVFVVLRERTQPEGSAGAVLFEGITDNEGRCQGRLARPLALERVQMTLLAPGYEGRFDDPTLRTMYGPMAPAAWFSLAPGELANLSLDLTRKETSP